MKKILYFILVFCTISSCRTSTSYNSLAGKYYAIGKDYEYSLDLNKDWTFSLNFKSLNTKSGCTGKWEINKNLIELICNSPKDITETLQGGYLSDREIKIKIDNKGELFYNSILLKKKE